MFKNMFILKINDMIKFLESDLYYIERKYIFPTDGSQGYVATNETRDSKIKEPILNSCECSTNYRYTDTKKTICENKNEYQLLELEKKIGCTDKWVSVSPSIYKLGNLISENADNCGGFQYKEVWEGPFCGSEINFKYPTMPKLIETSSYKILIPYLKGKNDNDFVNISCNEYLDSQLVSDTCN